MTKHLLLVLLLMMYSLIYGKTITFVTANQKPISDVRCIGYNSNNDSIATWISDKGGIIDIQSSDVKYLVASKSGFGDKIIFNNQLNTGNIQVILSPGVELKEVVVTPSDVEDFATHTSYRLSQKSMENYSNVLQSLNEIPNLTVLSNGSVFFEGNTNIKILIDGVDATVQEVQTLSKEDISKIDVYQTPPLRFIAQGVSAVLNIRLKSKIHGGNFGIDISQAFQSLKGNNSAALYYNYRQSRFSILYNNENTHYRKYRQSEVLDYEFGNVHYNKVKEGLDSKRHYDDNNLNLTYQINKPDNFLYNVKAGFDISRNGRTSHQNVRTASDSFLAINKLRTDYSKYLVGNYFEKDLGEKAGNILANINYQHFSTFYNSFYDEFSESDIAVNDSRSNYKTNFNAIFSEIQYQLPYNKLGGFTICAYENYKHSKYKDTSSPFFQTTNTLGAAAQWVGAKRNVRWFLSLGVSWLYTSSINIEKAYSIFMPSPLVNIIWKPSKNIQFTFNYSYSGDAPTIAQLSETDQWIDKKLVYHGNSRLKPYKVHSAGFYFNWYFRYLNLSLRNNFESSRDRICDMYTRTDKYMLQTLVNLNTYRQWSTQLDLSIMPFGNNKLVFWNRIRLADLKGKNQEYSWHGYRFQWMSNLALNLKHWTAEIFYQYPGKIVEGQLERPRAQCWSLTVLYRPMTNLSVGVEWFMPFGNGFKESEHTVNSAPVYADTECKIMDYNNLLSIKLSYNFSFGRNRNKANRQYDNFDNDSGVLIK